jgi:hypothetical protein
MSENGKEAIDGWSSDRSRRVPLDRSSRSIEGCDGLMGDIDLAGSSALRLHAMQRAVGAGHECCAAERPPRIMDSTASGTDGVGYCRRVGGLSCMH